MRKLEVLLDGRWQYVFCRKMPDDKPMPTATRWKALPDFHLEWFQNHFANHQFRASCNSEAQDNARREAERRANPL